MNAYMLSFAPFSYIRPKKYSTYFLKNTQLSTATQKTCNCVLVRRVNVICCFHCRYKSTKFYWCLDPFLPISSTCAFLEFGLYAFWCIHIHTYTYTHYIVTSWLKIHIQKVLIQMSFSKVSNLFHCLGYCEGDGYRVGFGPCKGAILPALQHWTHLLLHTVYVGILLWSIINWRHKITPPCYLSPLGLH